MGRGPSRKTIWEKELLRILSSAVTGLFGGTPPDERLSGITFTRVCLSGDKSRAEVFFQCSMSGLTNAEAKELLHEHRGWLRSAAAQGLNGRHTPELVFRFDAALEKENRIEDLLWQIKKEHEQD